MHADSSIQVGGAAPHSNGLGLGRLGLLLGHHRWHSLGTAIHHAVAILLWHALLLLLLLLQHLGSCLRVHAAVHHALQSHESDNEIITRAVSHTFLFSSAIFPGLRASYEADLRWHLEQDSMVEKPNRSSPGSCSAPASAAAAAAVAAAAAEGGSHANDGTAGPVAVGAEGLAPAGSWPGHAAFAHIASRGCKWGSSGFGTSGGASADPWKSGTCTKSTCSISLSQPWKEPSCSFYDRDISEAHLPLTCSLH